MDRPLHLQVSAVSEQARQAVEAAGGSVTTVYYNRLGLRALLKVGGCLAGWLVAFWLADWLVGWLAGQGSPWRVVCWAGFWLCWRGWGRAGRAGCWSREA